MDKGFGYWLRWIIVLPGAIAVGILSTFPLHWILLLAFAHDGATIFGLIEFEHGIDIEPIEYMLYPAVIAATFVIAGYKIAPEYKFKTALALFVIYTLGWLAVIFFAQFKGDINIQIPIRAILAILGAAIGLYGARLKTKEN